MSRRRVAATANAVILAAGQGSRISTLTGGRPKCLLPVRRTSLIERQVAILRQCGIRRVTVVVGYNADMVRHACGAWCNFVENVRYAETNSLYSLWLAKDHLAEGAIVLNADVLFHGQMLADLVDARHDDALLVAFRNPTGPALGDEEMKVAVQNGCVTSMSKTLPEQSVDGENVGIAKFGRDGAPLLVDCLDRLVSEGATRDWAPRAYADFARGRSLHAIGTRGLPWIEIDSPDDYFRALTDVVPCLDWRARDGVHTASPIRRRTGTEG